jgi:hypothetical protein
MHHRDTVDEIFRDLPGVLDESLQRRKIDFTNHCRTKMRRESAMMSYRILNLAIKLRAL